MGLLCCFKIFCIGIHTLFIFIFFIIITKSEGTLTVDQLLKIKCEYPKSHLCLPLGVCCSGDEFCYEGQCHDCFPKEAKDNLLVWCRELGLHNVSLMRDTTCGLACQARFNVSELNDYNEYQKIISALSQEISQHKISMDNVLKEYQKKISELSQEISQHKISMDNVLKDIEKWRGAFIGCLLINPLVVITVLLIVYKRNESRIPCFHLEMWRDIFHCNYCRPSVPANPEPLEQHHSNGSTASAAGQGTDAPQQPHADNVPDGLNITCRQPTDQLENRQPSNQEEKLPLMPNCNSSGQNNDVPTSSNTPPIKRNQQSTVGKRINVQ